MAALRRCIGWCIKLELPEQLDARLHLLKMHLPYHESDHVLNLAYNVMCGGTRLEDIERLRHDTAYMNAVDRQGDRSRDAYLRTSLFQSGVGNGHDAG